MVHINILRNLFQDKLPMYCWGLRQDYMVNVKIPESM